MRSIQLTELTAPLEEREAPDPTSGASEVVVEIRAAGICHSDAHYRAGHGRVRLPRTLGHEIAGVIIETGEAVTNVSVGDRVAVHYLISCGECDACVRGGEQFCVRGEMLGKERDGGFAERIAVPARNTVPIPPEIPFEEAAVMMCSTATVYHALRLAGLRPGESVAIIGFGGLGASALQLARALGAALKSLAPGGRLMLVALGPEPFTFDPYADVLTRERRIIGCSDHLLSELPDLMDFARRGSIELSSAITRRVPFEAPAINSVLDDLDRRTGHLRAVAIR